MTLWTRVNSTVIRLLHDTSESCSKPELWPSLVDASINRCVGCPARARLVVIWAKIVAAIRVLSVSFCTTRPGRLFPPAPEANG
jgi:hypothetical protein